VASFGPGAAGGWYLIGLARWLPEAFGGDAFGIAGAGEELGLLRMERLLATPEDANALVVDPLTPPDLRAALQGG
jgi:glycosyltransferase A (GT-A) superfamily protein (DUF2064 family)